MNLGPDQQLCHESNFVSTRAVTHFVPQILSFTSAFVWLRGFAVKKKKKNSKANDWIRHETPAVPFGLLWGHQYVSFTLPGRTVDLKMSRDSAVRQPHRSRSPWVSGPQKDRLFTTLQLWCFKTVKPSLFQFLKFLRMLLGPSESSHIDKICLCISQYPGPPCSCLWLVSPEAGKTLPPAVFPPGYPLSSAVTAGRTSSLDLPKYPPDFFPHGASLRGNRSLSNPI